jgi:hypothetical protein
MKKIYTDDVLDMRNTGNNRINSFAKRGNERSDDTKKDTPPDPIVKS